MTFFLLFGGSETASKLFPPAREGIKGGDEKKKHFRINAIFSIMQLSQHDDMILALMKTWEKIFLTFSFAWIAIVYFAYYKGIVNGILLFHPNLLERIKGLLS
jgi:hypothetical protein